MRTSGMDIECHADIDCRGETDIRKLQGAQLRLTQVGRRLIGAVVVAGDLNEAKVHVGRLEELAVVVDHDRELAAVVAGLADVRLALVPDHTLGGHRALDVGVDHGVEEVVRARRAIASLQCRYNMSNGADTRTHARATRLV